MALAVLHVLQDFAVEVELVVWHSLALTAEPAEPQGLVRPEKMATIVSDDAFEFGFGEAAANGPALHRRGESSGRIEGFLPEHVAVGRAAPRFCGIAGLERLADHRPADFGLGFFWYAPTKIVDGASANDICHECHALVTPLGHSSRRERSAITAA
jgi:hypothetical protein